MFDKVKEIANNLANKELTCVTGLYHLLRFNINNSHDNAMNPLIYNYMLGTIETLYKEALKEPMKPFIDILNRADINEYSTGIKILTLQNSILMC
jgi:hypothetical protein